MFNTLNSLFVRHSTIYQSPPPWWQNIFTTRKLPYGAQYEISRLVSHGKLKYDDMKFENVITLAKMETNKEAAPATARIMVPSSKFASEDDESYGMSLLFLY
jgi:RNA-dependent RNA polymerase